MVKRQDLTGKVFGTIKVIKYKGVGKNYQHYWECQCLKCGKHSIKRTSGIKKRCVHCTVPKHRQVKTRLYRIWGLAKNRCNNLNNKDYGGRGIRLCEEWKTFDNFFEWAGKSGYNANSELDRIDVNGNYCPENCRWTTPRVQQNNRRNNRIIEIDNKKNTLVEWCRIYKINYHTVFLRLKRGWDVIRALKTTEIGKAKPFVKYTINGISKTLYEWSEEYKINDGTVRKRMKKGMSLAEALGVVNA